MSVSPTAVSKRLKVSLIITTYNNEKFLSLAIETAIDQTRLFDEIVIADDGSRNETAETIKKFARFSPVPILHTWQPDEGFRPARARNNAVAVASGDYLIFLDGDCFLNRYFVEDHLSLASLNYFITGTRVNIRKKRQDYIFRTGNHKLNALSWGISKNFNAIRCPFLSPIYFNKAGMASANFSVWRNDFIKINGFNEIYVGHSSEDTDLANRLMLAGIKRRRMVHRGMVYHFDHPSHSKSDNEQIKALYPTSVDATGIWCYQGYDRAIKERETLLR